jgi:integrase/recombinase XerD
LNTYALYPSRSELRGITCKNKKGNSALFLNHEGDRLQRRGVSDAVTKAAERVGLHNAESERLEDHFGPHCARHWNTTYLLRAGMKREYVQWLRGDAIKEAVDIYFHIDPKDVQKAYLAAIPQLGI